MSIFNSVREIIRVYGSCVTVHKDGEKISARAFVQPIRYTSKYYVGGKYHRAGLAGTDRYLYIGSPDIALSLSGTVIQTESGKYIVKRSEIYRVGGNKVYTWAILAPYGSTLEDEYESD